MLRRLFSLLLFCVFISGPAFAEPQCEGALCNSGRNSHGTQQGLFSAFTDPRFNRQAALIHAVGSVFDATVGRLGRWGWQQYRGAWLPGVSPYGGEAALDQIGEAVTVELTGVAAGGMVSRARALSNLSNYGKMNQGIAAARTFRVPGAGPTTIADDAIQFGTDVLGRGSGGTVYRGTMNGEEVAVKLITDHYNPKRLTPKSFAHAEEYARRQAEAFEILSENNIGNVRYHGTVNVGGRTGIVTNLVGDVGPYGRPYVKIPGEWVLSVEDAARFGPRVAKVAQQVEKLGYVFSDTEYAILKSGDIAIMDPMLTPIGKALIPESMTPWEYSVRQMTFVKPTGFIQ